MTNVLIFVCTALLMWGQYLFTKTLCTYLKQIITLLKKD